MTFLGLSLGANRRTELLLWSAAVCVSLIAVVVWRASVPKAADAPAAPVMSGQQPVMFDEELFVASADNTVAHDPFRLDRHPAGVAFGTPPAPPPAAVGTAPGSTFVLKGIVGGPPWQAVLTGIPGREGNVIVMAGDTVAGARIRAVTRTGVVVVNRDSVRTLTLKPSWQ